MNRTVEVERKNVTFTIYDAIVLSFMVLLAYGIGILAKNWTGPLVYKASISLSPVSLIGYTFFSMARGFAAYGLSLVFTFAYGYAAARNKYAERILIPLLDVFQSVPVLGFLPGLILGMMALFPHSVIGLEIASIVMIFTGQVWNMTFSFYQSLKSIPQELIEASKIYGLSGWRIFWGVEVPFAMPGLVWNSMMSMAGGWFFLSVCEAFTLGGTSYRIAGIGSYMATAVESGYIPGELYAILAMVLMILAIDTFFWKPIVAWSDKFKVEENTSSEEPTSFVLDILRNSHVLRFFRTIFSSVKVPKRYVMQTQIKSEREQSKISGVIIYTILGSISVWILWKFFTFIGNLDITSLNTILFEDGLTALRVYAAVALSVAWTLPIGILIGKNVSLSKKVQPIVQILASFPAPMIYPWFVMIFPNLNYSSILLMLLGTQWYILFNVIAGASSIPNQLKEAAEILKLSKFKVWTTLYIPTVLPFLITGMITAAGGAWNASIVTEYMTFNHKILEATGIGAFINEVTVSGKMRLLVLSIVVMSLSVVIINRVIWRPLQRWAMEKFSLN
jgi:NitT/TauT family transport system permease protein